MKAELIQILSTYGYPVSLQGSYGPTEKYPDAFFTFWNGDTYDMEHFNDRPAAFTWSFDVNFYATDPALVNSTILDVRNRLKENGWIVDGVGYDVPVDEPTHTGRGLIALFRETNKTEV